MKKLLLFASALAGLFLAASCQQESLEPVGGNTVTYTVQVPGALSTKAIGTDVAAVTELIYEVYRIDENDVETRLYQKSEIRDAANGETNWTVELELVNNQDFRVLFWAQVPGNGVYTTTDLKAVTLATDLSANAENYAAFAGSEVIIYEAGKSYAPKTVTLERPVAQLNIATSAESLKLGEDGNAQTTVVFNTTGVVVEGLSTVYNVAEGAGVAANDGATFTYEAKQVALSENKINVNNVDYTYVSMNYVGFASKTGDNVKVSYTINTTNVGTITNTVENVPVKANHRTNIIGNLITSTSDYTVTLSATWPTEQTNLLVVDSATGLKKAIDNAKEGEEITLTGDIDLSELFPVTKAAAALPIVIAEGKSVVLNLNGYKITTPFVAGSTTNHTYAFENRGVLTIKDAKGEGEIVARGIFNYGKMTLESGTINACDGNGGYGVRNYEGAEFVMNGGSIVTSNEDDHQVDEGGYDATTLRVDTGATATINGGTISNICDFTYAIDNHGTATVNGGTFESVHSTVSTYGTMTINGGSFICDGIEGITAHCLVAWEDSQTTINGGSFNGKDNYNGFNIDADEGAVVNITGGEFLPVHSGSLYGKGVIKVSGGTFFDDPSARLESGYKAEKKNDKYVVTEKDSVAKIGEKGYWSLNAAVAAVQDGETITLVADETFTATNYYNNGGWKDGLGYSGDKSFTIDLGGYTIKQDGSLNDYLVWIKNDGAKANTITFKNGTMDAGKTAYCALCTANSHENKLTVNLENITLINENSNGSTVKIRAGSELNVRAGTKITGKNSYLGVENWNAVVNIYDGAEIYMNGTTSYNGCLVGVGGNGTVNVYGGYGKGVSGGLIAMTSGGTINAMGGEWIANTDGTFANSNKSVLVAQSDKQYNAGAGNAVVNVTGGTYKGGYNCYGNAVGDAQINIKGGNFNADPTSYVVNGYKAVESNGVYNVVVDPVAKIGETEYATLQEAFNAGGEITLLRDVKLTEKAVLEAGKTVVLDLNGFAVTVPETTGSHIYALDNKGTLTIKDSKENGSISSRGIYNYGTLTLDSGKLSAIDGNGGYAVNNEPGATFVMNGGWIAADYEDGDEPEGSNYDATALDVPSGAEATLNGGKITNAGNFTFAVSASGTLNIPATSTLTIVGRHGAIAVSGGLTTVSAGSYSIPENTLYTDNVVYVGGGELVINGGTFTGDADKAQGGACVSQLGGKVTINGGVYGKSSGGDVYGVTGSMTIKGGKFENLIETQHIAEGYELNANGEVVKK